MDRVCTAPDSDLPTWLRGTAFNHRSIFALANVSACPFCNAPFQSSGLKRELRNQHAGTADEGNDVIPLSSPPAGIEFRPSNTAGLILKNRDQIKSHRELKRSASEAASSAPIRSTSSRPVSNRSGSRGLFMAGQVAPEQQPLSGANQVLGAMSSITHANRPSLAAKPGEGSDIMNRFCSKVEAASLSREQSIRATRAAEEVWGIHFMIWRRVYERDQDGFGLEQQIGGISLVRKYFPFFGLPTVSLCISRIPLA